MLNQSVRAFGLFVALFTIGCVAHAPDEVSLEGELFAIADDDDGPTFVLDRGPLAEPRFTELSLAEAAARDAQQLPPGAEVMLEGVDLDGLVFTSRVTRRESREAERAQARRDREARREARRAAREARREARRAAREARRRAREERRRERDRCDPESETEVLRVLAIGGDYVDAPLPCDDAAVEEMLFSGAASVDAFYRLGTFEAVGIAGDVVGPYPLSISSTDACDPTLVQNELVAAAEAAGVNLDDYDKVLFNIPRGTCAWNGRATIGGRYLWSQYCNNWYVAAHELGHTIELGHAGTPGSEYGDRSDVMGSVYCGFNAPHHVQKGWLSADKVTEDGSFAIGAISSGPGDATILQVERETDSLFVSFRVDALSALNERYAMGPRFVDRVSIQSHNGTSAKSVVLARLAAGESYTDPESGVTITHDAFVDATANVTLRFE